MFNLLKLVIPSGTTKEIPEVESFTVTWQVYTGWSGEVQVKHKVFISENDAREFKAQLVAAAKLLDSWLGIKINKN